MWNYLLTIRLRMASPLALLFLASIANANLVTNGDFESGDQDFITDYNSGSPTAQGYGITTDPSLWRAGAPSYGDHTSGSGNMMAVNAATTANQLVWGQDVSLTANTDYKFTIWISSWSPDYLASLIFDIGGISLGSVIAPSEITIWEQYSFFFNSGTTSGPSQLSIIDTTRSFAGDDFALDDISVNAVPLPPAAWLFASGLLGLIGVARRKAA